jgi:hypothetical protein
MSLELRSIAEGCALDHNALDRTWAAINRSHKNYVAAELNNTEKQRK